MEEEKDVKDVVEEKNDDTPKNEKKNIFSRIWNGLSRLHGDNFEKRLQYIYRAEATILARMKKRSTRWRRTARSVIVYSVLLEVVAMGYALTTTRSVNLEWKARALRVLPIFLLPVLSWALYSGLRTLKGMCDRRDKRTLEGLRAERKAKINELKDRTNYYNTQQLIQRYDPDPAAKAAATSVLASRLGADSGLQASVEDESHLNQYGIGTSSDVELVQSSGLRRRNQSEGRSPVSVEREALQYAGSEVSEIPLPSELVVEHHGAVAINPQDGNWIARLAALLVGEDPTQSYALICGNCHMHNGLARKEDFLVITYYCPHCHSLNKPRNLDENSSGTNSPDMRSANKPRKSTDNSSEIDAPDMGFSRTHRHALNKPRNPDEKSSTSSDTNTHALDKSRNSNENSSDNNTSDMKSLTRAVSNSNLIKQSNGSICGNASNKSTHVALAEEDCEKKCC